MSESDTAQDSSLLEPEEHGESSDAWLREQRRLLDLEEGFAA